MSLERQFFALVMMSLFMMMSCSHTGKVLNKEHSRKEEIPNTSGLENQGNFYEKLVDKIEKNDHKAALEIIQDESGKGQGLYHLIKYVSAINGLIVEGKKKLNRGDYQNSGKIFNFVIQNYPDDLSQKEKLINSEQKLNEYLYFCSEKIMEIGLAEYRKGNLWNAVSTWEKILIFNPHYIEANNAIESTKKQMKNIQSLGNSNK